MKAITCAIAIVLALAASAAMSAESAATAQADQNAQTLATHVCANCHGPGGDSRSPTFPRLAAQQAPYIGAQIKAFRAKTRGEPEAHNYMLGMVALFDDATAEALGRYFAEQTAARGTPGDPPLVAEGAKLFGEGAGAQGIPACATCHGADAHGNGIFPRLAGQHAQYIVKQLHAIQTQTRQSPVMHGIIKNLTPAQMKAVAAYLQSLS